MYLRLLAFVIFGTVGCGGVAEDPSTVPGESRVSGQAGEDGARADDTANEENDPGNQDPSDPSSGDVEIPTFPEPDVSCAEASDCEVKDVGSCCGSYPKCVNRDYEPDQEALAAYCQENEVSSTCEVPDVLGCACVDGLCVDSSGGPI